MNIHYELDEGRKKYIACIYQMSLFLGEIVGHVAREHARLMWTLLQRDDVAIEGFSTGGKPRWSKRAGGHEVAITIHVISKDEELIRDMNTLFKRKHYIVQ